MSVKEITHMAMLARAAGRQDDMVAFAKQLAQSGAALDQEAKDVIVFAYTASIQTRRDSWESVEAVRQVCESVGGRGAHSWLRSINDYKGNILGEIKTLCNGFLTILSGHLITNARSPTEEIFYRIKKADCYRYLAEVGKYRDFLVNLSRRAYQDALTLSQRELKAYHPVRLMAVSNFCTLYSTILKSPVRAAQLAQSAIDGAIKELNSEKSKKLTFEEALDKLGTKGESYQSSIPLLKDLKTNLSSENLDEKVTKCEPPENILD